MTPTKVRLVDNSSLNSIKVVPEIGEDLIKSLPSTDVKAYYENPLRLAEATSYKEKPTSLSYSVLYQMSVKNSVVAAVINTRVNQVSMFSKPSRFSTDSIGFEIRLRDPNKPPTDEQKDIMTSIELFLENTGYRDSADRDDFDTFIRKIVRDSLTYDQVCFEIVPDRKGRPAEFYAVDASTIRAASESFDPQDSWGSYRKPKRNESVKWVQVIDGIVMAWFTASELAFGVRNPRTHIGLQPYGFSELEQLIHQVTSHLFAEEYNAKFFSQGGTTKGIINIKADPNGVGNREQLESFKRQWRAQVNGMTGAWKTPVLQVPQGIEYVNVSQSNRDMEFSQWMNYLVNIVCAIYQIDPAEVNFSNNGGAMTQGSVFESSQEAKLKNSKDKGLKPLLRFVETLINKFIVSKFSQDYVFSFTGLDEKSEQERAGLDSQHVKTWKTVNEIRKDHGMEPLEHGDVLLDSSYLNYINQQAMQQQSSPGGSFEEESTSDEEYSEERGGYSSYDESQELAYDQGVVHSTADYEDAGVIENPGAETEELSENQENELDKSLSKLILTIR